MKVIKKIPYFVAVMLVAYSCYAFWTGFVRQSLFAWTFRQDGYWDSVVEIAAVCWIYFLLLCRQPSKKWMKYIPIGLLFLAMTFLHSIFWAALVDIAYLLMIYFLGKGICKLLHTRLDSIARLHCFVLIGISGIILIIAFLSFFSLAYPQTLRYIFVVLFLGELVVFRKDVFLCIKNFFQQSDSAKIQNRKRYGMCVLEALALAGITLIACRANLGLDYDTVWYSVKSQYALVPEGSIYDPIYLLACVFSYSKGFEILTLVFSGLNSYSFLIGMNVILGCLTFHAVYCIGRVIGIGQKSWIMVTILGLNPAIMNMVMVGKPDILGLYLTAVMILFAVCFMETEHSVFFFLVIAAGVLTFSVKITSVLFTSILFVCFIVVIIIQKRKIQWKSIWIAFLTILATFVVLLRTFLLTGYPLNVLVTSFFKSIGYYPKYPYHFNPVRVTSLGDLLSDLGLFKTRIIRLWEIFFAPVSLGMENTMRTWWGPLLTFIMISAAVLLLVHFRQCFCLKKENGVRLFLSSSLLLIMMASIGSMLLLDYADGNYFMIWNMMATVFWTLECTSLKMNTQKILVGLLVPLLACNFLLENGITCSWTVGLTPTDLSNKGYYNHEEKYILPRMRDEGLEEIYFYLKDNKHRHIIFAGNEETVFSLPTAMDSYVHINAWESQILEGEDSFWEYLTFAKVDALLVDNENKTDPNYLHILLELAEDGDIGCEYSTGRYMLFQILPDGGEPDQDAIRYLRICLGEETANILE